MRKLFLTGLLISFLGTLPLGTLNVAAMQLSLSEGILPAIGFSSGALLVEMVYVRLSLVAMAWVRKQTKWFRILEWLSVCILFALALGSFIAATHPSGGRNVILSSGLPRFLLGAAMSAVNPLQIPFWFGWSSILYERGVLKPSNSYFNVYIGGIGLGTFLGNAAFIFGGRLLTNAFNGHQSLIDWIIGGVFAIAGLLQWWKIVRSGEPVR